MRSATMAAACSPDEQKRLMVMAGVAVGQPGQEADLARDVQALLGLGVGAAEHEVLDVGRRRSRRGASPRAPPARPRSSGRVFLKHAARGAADGGPNGRENGDVTHGHCAPQFRRGLLLVNMCWMRSRVFGSPHSDRNASRSRSRMCCSLTAAPAGTAPPERTRARWPLDLGVVLADLVRAEQVVQRRPQRGGADLADDADAARRRRPVAGARQPQRQLPWRRRSASRAPSRPCRPGGR